MKKEVGRLVRKNLNLAKGRWVEAVSRHHLQVLRSLTENYGFAVALGDLLFLEGGWYVTHAGLLRFAARSRCNGIRVEQVRNFCDPVAGRWVFKATVYKSPSSKGFVGYGDADPSNVSLMVHGAELRIAETRAVNRALRKAYGIGLCSVEELGSPSSTRGPGSDHASETKHSTNGSSNGQPRLRDQLCLLIRQHNLDPVLVKAYAADFCGAPSLKEANRDLVQSFVTHLAACANENKEMLICRLNSYAQPAEVKA